MSRFVAGHARRRPSSEQQSSQEMSLKEGTQIIHGLIQELSALKYVYMYKFNTFRALLKVNNLGYCDYVTSSFGLNTCT